MSDTPNKKVVGTGYATTTPPLTATANIPKTTEIPISDEVIQEIPTATIREALQCVRGHHASPAGHRARPVLVDVCNGALAALEQVEAIIRQQQERIKELEGEIAWYREKLGEKWWRG